MRKLLFLIAFMLPFALSAQQKTTVSGYVTDAQTGERLYAATVYEQNSGTGTISNRFGFFSISLPEGSAVLKVSFVGYEIQNRRINLKADTIVSFALKSDNKLNEVVVKGTSAKPMFENNDLGHVKISARSLAKLPSLMGEKDVMKSLMILPGVQQGSEGSSGIFVRGGSPDQNLILLDDVPLYNVSHLLGFVSVLLPKPLTASTFTKGVFRHVLADGSPRWWICG